MTDKRIYYADLISTPKIFGLLFFWLFGILFGCFLSVTYFDSISSLMRIAFYQRVSIVGSLICVFLPMILSAWAVVKNRSCFVFLICFLKAVAFAFCSGLISELFGDAGWLVRFLFLFSDHFTLIILFVLWVRSFHCDSHFLWNEWAYCFLLAGIVVILDQFIISPFIMQIL